MSTLVDIITIDEKDCNNDNKKEFVIRKWIKYIRKKIVIHEVWNNRKLDTIKWVYINEKHADNCYILRWLVEKVKAEFEIEKSWLIEIADYYKRKSEKKNIFLRFLKKCVKLVQKKH